MQASQRTRLVGRASELAALRGELAAVLRGEGRLVVLAGEFGSGRTRVATALAAEAQDAGALVAWGRCHERDGAPPYWPWVQVLASCAKELPGSSAEELAALLPALRAAPLLLSSADTEPARARFELFERVAAALAPPLRARPIVAILDDVHWAEVGSLLLLEFLTRELANLPLLVVATLHEAELRQGTERARALASLARLGRSLPLPGLTRPEVCELLEGQLGRAPEDDVVDAVFGATEGNPFFVIETAQLLAAAPAASSRGRFPPSVPRGVEEVLRRRLEPVAPASLRLLEAAAVFGREFTLDPLASALDSPVPALLDALSVPLELGLVREVPDALRRYAFSHALMREMLLQGLAPAARIALHGALARALETSAPGDHELWPALAHHFFESAQAADPAKAVHYGCLAGERALRLLAFEEAVVHFERALAALGLAGDDDAQLRALCGLGEALRETGDPARGDAMFRTAIERARRRGASVFAETVQHFARTRVEPALLDVELNALLEEALAALPAEPSLLRARLLARLAAGLMLDTNTESRRRELSDAATGMARALGDAGTLGYVLGRRVVGLLAPGYLEERIATLDEILRAPGIGRSTELEALVFRVDALAERGDRSGLELALTTFEQRLRSRRDPFFLWTGATFRASIAMLEGRFADAESFAREALSLGRHARERLAFIRFAQQLFFIRGWQSRLSEVDELVERAVAETSVVPAWRCALADLYSLMGREAEMRREFEALAANDFAGVPRDANWLISISLLSSVCGRLRDVRRAGVLYELLLPLAGCVAVARPLVVIGEPVDRSLGVLATVLRRHAEAEAHFGRALALAERMRALPWQAEIRFQWAELLRQRASRGDAERAHKMLGDAERIAETIGMQLLLRWIAEARKATSRSSVVTLVPRAPRQEPSSPRTGGFRRDGDVWTLTFEGRLMHLPHMLGLAHLARLLAQPGREVHAKDLGAAAHSVRRESGAVGADAGDSGELLDARARASYQARLSDASEELAEAERHNDRGRIERLGEEIEMLRSELSRGFGLGGRSRRAGSASERARSSVTRAIRYAIDKIAEQDPALAEHLRLGVRTGAFCVYEPSTRDPVSWTA